MSKLVLIAVLAGLFSFGVFTDTRLALRTGRVGLRMRFKHDTDRPDAAYSRGGEPFWFWGLVGARILFCAALDIAVGWDLLNLWASGLPG